jgi:hypothetical protein
MGWWNKIVTYYTRIGEMYHVNTVIFVGIHIIATPLFAAAVWWIIYNKKQKKSIFVSSLTAVFIFNAASIYLVVCGRNIPFYIYLIVGLSAVISSYFSYRKIKKRIASVR